MRYRLIMIVVLAAICLPSATGQATQTAGVERTVTRIIDRLTKQLQSKDRFGRSEAFSLIAKELRPFGPQAAPAVPLLFRGLEQAVSEGHVFLYASDIGDTIVSVASTAAIPTLIDSLGARTPFVRSVAVSAITNLGSASVPWLLEALRKGSCETGQSAAEALARIQASQMALGSWQETVAVLAAVLKSGQACDSTRAEVVQSLGVIDRNSVDAQLSIVGALSDPSYVVRGRALDVLKQTRINTRGVVPGLRHALTVWRRDTNDHVANHRRYAEFVIIGKLQEIGPDAHSALPDVLSLPWLTGDAYESSVVERLGPPDEESVPALVDALSNNSAPIAFVDHWLRVLLPRVVANRPMLAKQALDRLKQILDDPREKRRLATLMIIAAVPGLAGIAKGHTEIIAADDRSPSRIRIWAHAVAGTSGSWSPPSAEGLRIGHASEPTSLRFSSDGHSIATAGSDGTIKIWDIARGNVTRTVVVQHEPQAPIFSRYPPSGAFTSWPVLADGARYAAAVDSSGTAANVFDLTDSASVRSVRTGASIQALALMSDGRTLAVANSRGLFVYRNDFERELDNAQDVPTNTRQRGATAVRFSADGQFLATVHGSTVAVWNVEKGTRVFETTIRRSTNLSSDLDDISAAAISAKSDLLAFASGEKVSLYSLPDGQPRRVLAIPSGHRATVLEFSNDSELLLVSTVHARSTNLANLLVWDVASGDLRYRVDDAGAAATFSPVDSIVATTKGMLWDNQTGTLPQRLSYTGDITELNLAQQPDSIPFNVRAVVRDRDGKEYHLTQVHTSSRLPTPLPIPYRDISQSKYDTDVDDAFAVLPYFDRQLTLIGREHIWLPYIQRVRVLTTREDGLLDVEASLRSGRIVRGMWRPNTASYQMYSDERTGEALQGRLGDRFIRIPVTRIAEVVFDATPAEIKRFESVVEVLRDGAVPITVTIRGGAINGRREFRTEKFRLGYLLDVAGMYSESYYDFNLTRSLRITTDGLRMDADVRKVQSITFGDVLDEQVEVSMIDGRQVSARIQTLYESHHGMWSFGHFEKDWLLALADDGFVSVPASLVQKIEYDRHHAP